MEQPLRPLGPLLTLVDKTTNVRTSYGHLASKRTVGAFTLYLTYREEDRIWFVVADRAGGPLMTAGYHLPRREECWEFFLYSTEEHILAMRDEEERVRGARH